MIKGKARSGYRIAALGVASALLLGGCAASNDASSDGDPADVGFVNLQDAGDAVDGGTLTFGSYSFPNSLDPTKTQTSGSTGGSEMAAIYDVLVRSEDGEYVPQLAESLSSNDDFSEFTITLRDDVSFSDGSTLDADAVKWSIDRFITAGADVAQAWSNIVQEISTPDASTVKFTLKDSWDDFPVLLSTGPGLIVGQGSETGDSFTPIGAGPFTQTKFAPSEELVLAGRDDYFDGKPALDSLRFVPSSGATSQWESLESGQLNMAYILRNETVIKEAMESGSSGYLDVVGLGSLGLINNREGRPGADVRVRQAIAYGVDPEVINQRANNGLGIASSEILPETSTWHDDAEGIAFDPEKAKSLLAEAQADGYDGKLTYLTNNEPSAEAAALAVQAQLNSIGFDVNIDYAPNVTDLVRKLYVDHDFDLTRAAYQFMDEAPYLRLYAGLGSNSRNNASGSTDDEMDGLLSNVQTATTEDAKIEAISKVQERVNETSPYALWGPEKIFIAWDDSVHGVKRSADNMILFDEVWVG